MTAEKTLVLVVDDNPAGLYTKSRILRAAGFEVVEAPTGFDGLRMVHELKPRLALVDVRLPDLDGREVCRRIKSDPATAPVLVLQLSATFSGGEDTVRSLEEGADGCLTEPVDPTVLVATVRALLRARAAEDTLREALLRESVLRQSADAANRAKDEFLATLSHELRSPLNTILTWVTLLQDALLPPDKQKEALEAIDRNARVQLKLVDDLLDVSRIVSGKMRLDLSLVEIGAVLDAALDSVRHAAEARGILVRCTVDPGLGPLRADATRLQQILWNLLSNAVKFTPRGGRITVDAAARAGQVEIRVSDTGSGIAPEHLPHIFERFQQVDGSSTRMSGGLGLGLAIVRHLVELHGGTVEASSAGLGAGTAFTVRLPLPAAANGVRSAVSEPAAISSRLHTLRGLRVLLVDDESDARDALQAVLRQCGARVVTAGSVHEAIEQLDREVPDVLVSDIAMPVEDGYALIRRLRSRPAGAGGGIPAVAVTAYGSPHDQAHMAEAGFDAYQRKPVEVAALVDTISRLAAART